MNQGGVATAIPYWLMLILLEYIGVLVLVAISLAGFAFAVMGTFAIWFNRRS